MSLDTLQVKFEVINVNYEQARNAKTPAALEAIILKDYALNPGDFVLLEWDKFTDDILVTSDRSALISHQTSK